MSDSNRHRLLFICLGNICRSPLAEGIFLHKANARGVAEQFTIDSAGTGGWHVGDPPDPRAREVAERHGVRLVSRGRQIEPGDTDRFDLLLCMDRDNYRKVERLGARPDQIHLMLEFLPEDSPHEVPDPYYGGDDGFDHVFDLLDRSCENLLDQLTARPEPSSRQ